MPTFRYRCFKDRGGCGKEFTARKSIGSRMNVVCPSCGTNWLQKKKLADGSRIPIIDILMEKVEMSELEDPYK